jgi:hypothetical protein
MRRLLAVILVCAGMFCVAQSNAFFQSRDSNYNIAITSATYTAQGVHFNGSTELWNPSGLNAPMTGATDGKKGTLSMWVREGQDGTTDGILAAFNVNACQVTRISGGYWRVLCDNSASTTILICGTTAALNVAAGWTHIAASWDLSVPVLQVYVNGSSDACGNAGPTTTNDTIAYHTNNDGDVVGSLTGANYLTGDLADVYFDQANRLDLSVSINLQKFINGGNAVDLGTNCATPTGSQPIICLRGPVATWNNNVGSGGSFTIHAGSLSAASSNPP